MSEQSGFDGDTWASPTLPARSTDSEPGSSMELAAGETFGRYRVEKLIGRGGMGLVYAARDVELDRLVAVKIVRPDATAANTSASASASAMWRERLLREARALAQISHPNVVIVHDVGELDGRVFIAMELIVGTPLRPWWQAERSWRHKLRVLLGAARGLAAAHQAGIVHRDFKPENVIVTDEGVAKVLDFGLSRLAHAQLEQSLEPADFSAPTMPAGDIDSDNALTEVGAIMGTPAYMAPEQLLGNVTDARGDQFSFGAVLYEALSGRLPFEARSVGAIFAEISEQNVAPLPRGLPRWLSRIVLRMLRAEPTGRFPHMGAAIAALESGANRRRRLGQVAGVALVGLLGVVAVTSLTRGGSTPSCERAGEDAQSFWGEPQRQRLAASFAATNLAYAAPIATRTSAALDDFAQKWTAMRIEACRDTHERGDQSEELLDKRIACLERRRRAFATFTERLSGEIDEAVVNEATRAVLALPPISDCADRETLTSPQSLPTDPRARAEIEGLQEETDRIGAARLLPGDRKALLEETRALTEAVDALDYPPLAAEVYLLLAGLEDATGELDAAEAHYYRALWESVAGHSDRIGAETWLDLYFLVGDKREKFDESERIRGHAAAALERIGEPPQLMAEFLNVQGNVLVRAGKTAEAISRYEASVAKMIEVLGPDGFEVAIPLNNLGNAYRAEMRNDEALRSSRRALEIKEANLGPDHPSIAATLNNLAITLAAGGDEDGAIPLMIRAQAIKEATVGTATRSFGIGEANLATMLADKRRFAEALVRFRQATRSFEAELGASATMIGYSLTGEGQCLVELGDATPAVPLLERALVIRTSPKRHAEASISEMWLARALWDSGGDRARARKLAARALQALTAAPGNDLDAAAARAWLESHPL